MLFSPLLASYLLVLKVITIFTDVYTYMHIKRSTKQCSTTYHEENPSLKDMCKPCRWTGRLPDCKNQSNHKKKLDVPFPPVSYISYIPEIVVPAFALICISSSLPNFVLPYFNKIVIFCFFPTMLFLTLTVNIPLIVYLSRKNNFQNIVAKRQRINSIGWNRTENQQWEMKCAIENRENIQQI